MHSSIFFIVNARIGNRKIAQLTRALLLHMTVYKHEVHITQYGGHALELAKQAVDSNASLIVAVGGDGTVNEVLQAIVYSKIPLAIVPTGSGNGLARHCNIPLNIEQAVKLISTGHVLPIDIGKANDRFFISNAGVGFDAWVCHQIKQTTQRGLKMYVKEVIRNYFSYKSDTYTIQADDKTITEKAYFLNIANGKEFGYGFQIAPDASLQDGMLDMILVKKITPISGIQFVWDGWNKKISNNKDCIHLRAKRFILQGPQLNYFQTDGDAHTCNGTCVIEICKDGVHLLVPTSVENI
jgi:YegS/Rv2252/BmrU family lipid kinase